MPDPDKIREAEESIQNIASELKRVRDAAQLLQNTQKKADAVVSKTDQLIEETERFSSSIAVDLGQKLNNLKTMQDQLSTAMQKQNEDVQAGIEEARIAARGAKKRQVTMMGFMIIALIMLLSILLKI